MSNPTKSTTHADSPTVPNVTQPAKCRLCNKPLEGIEGSPFRASGGTNFTCGSCMKGFYHGGCNIL